MENNELIMIVLDEIIKSQERIESTLSEIKHLLDNKKD